MNFLKKIFYSIFKIEKYPEMSTEGVKAAIKYIVVFILLLSVVDCCVAIYNSFQVYEDLRGFIEEKFPDFQYKQGVLEVQGEQPIRLDSSNGNVKMIFDTQDKTDEEIETYKNELKETTNGGVLLLKEKMILIDENKQENEISYNESMPILNIENKDITITKDEILSKLTWNQMSVIYTSMFMTLLIQIFIMFFIVVIGVAYLIGVIGWMVAKLLNVKMKYRAVFNMAIYSCTLSIILSIVYLIVNVMTGFNIDLFLVMYVALACIYLIAAIFLTRIDLIKHQEELTKVVEVQKNIKQQEEQEEEEKKEDKETDDKKEKNKKKREKDEGVENKGGEPEGSNV